MLQYELNRIKTRKALNPEYRKHKPKRSEVNNFRAELKNCLASIKSLLYSSEISVGCNPATMI